MIKRCLSRIYPKTCKYFSTSQHQFEIIDVKNDHLVFVKDKQGKLPFLHEIITSDEQQGIVLKIQGDIAAIGFYHHILQQKNLTIKQVQSRKARSGPLTFNTCYDISLNQIGHGNNIGVNKKIKCPPEVEGKRTRLPVLNPVLSTCYNLFYGDFIVLEGCLGSGRTTAALSVLDQFVHQGLGNVGVYFNSNVSNKLQLNKAISTPRTFGFSRTSEQKPLSSVGVCMLASKCLSYAKMMKNEGKNVLLLMDNLNEVIENEWSVMKGLSLPLSPISILNDLYAVSSDSSKNSLTTIAMNTPEAQVHPLPEPQGTPFTNTPKHLKTLSKVVQFPLKICVNNHKFNTNSDMNAVREKLNKYLREKRDKQMVKKLKMDRDEPWELYELFDAEWWLQAFQSFSPVSIEHRNLFIWFIRKNIEEEMVARWKISCMEAFVKYEEYLAISENFESGMDDDQFEGFINLRRMEDDLDVFKKDYLR